MKKRITPLLLLAFLFQAYFIQAQTTFQVFTNEVFFDGYANGQLAKYNDSIPPSEGVKRMRTSLITKKLTPQQLSSIGNTLNLKVLIKASCDNYDRGGHVNLAFVPKGDTTYKLDGTTRRIEIARFITPFMDKNKKPDTVPYYYEINNVASLLKEKNISDSFDVWCELEVFGVPYAANTQIAGCAKRADVFLGTVEFTTTGANEMETNNRLVALGNQLNFNNYQAGATDVLGQTVRTLSFNLPQKLYGAKIFLITSNHGAGTGGEEYIRRDHFVYFDDKMVYVYTPGFTSCEPYRKYNTQANGIYGSTPKTDAQWQSFSNWCPGAYIPIRVIYLGTLEAGNHRFKIEVPEAFFQGADGNFPLSVYVQGKTDPVLGVNEVNSRLYEVNIFPNPAKDQEIVTIKSDVSVKLITVYSAEGKLVHSGTSTQLQTAEWGKGIYYIKLLFEDGNYVVKPFQKQ